MADKDGNRTNFEILNSVYNENKSFDVALQDQTSDAVIINFNKVINSTELVSGLTLYDNTIEVLDSTGINSGASYLILFDPDSVRFSTFYVTNVSGNIITLDSPVDFEYPVGTYVDISTTNLNVDGSSTQQVFGLRGLGIIPGIELTMDVTRIIFECVTTSPVDLSKFGDIIGGLENGLLLRKRDGVVNNIFNVKTNSEIAGIMYDYSPILATNPSQGVDGFVSRLTFGGQNKIGVVIRLYVGEDLELVVQDDLSNLTTFRVVAEGHIVECSS